jgi:hypothetical protein
LIVNDVRPPGADVCPPAARGHLPLVGVRQAREGVLKRADTGPAQNAPSPRVGTLDALLGDKDAVAGELDGIVRARVAGFGLEVLEKVSEKARLTVVLGEKGLADRVVKLL